MIRELFRKSATLIFALLREDGAFKRQRHRLHGFGKDPSLVFSSGMEAARIVEKLATAENRHGTREG